MKKLLAFLLAMAFLLGIAGVAAASLVECYDRGTFSSQGTIVYNYGYEDFGTDFSHPSNPWTSHGVTYTTSSNLIIGTGTSYAPISNVFAYDYWSPITADIDTSAQYDMIALDLGYLGTFSLITCEVYTNLGTYAYADISAPLASVSMDFY